MPLMSGSQSHFPVDNFNTTPGSCDLHPAIGIYFASPTGHVLVSAVAPLPVAAAVVFPPLASVAINDAGAGATEASVKVPGAAFTDGSLAAGGRDPLGAQYPIPLFTGGTSALFSQGLVTDLSVAADPLPSTSVLTPGGTPTVKFNILTAHVSAANAADVIRFEITINHSLGAAFDTLLATEDIVADAVGTANFVHIDSYVKDGASGVTLVVTNVTSGAVGQVDAVWTPLT